MKSITQTKFWQLPSALKLVVIWFFLFGLSSFWTTGSIIKTRHILEIGSLIRGIIECSLAIGLINRSNGSRAWAAFFMFLGSLFVLFTLAIAVFRDPNSTEGLNINYDKLTHTETIIFLVAYLILNVGILYVLMRSTTKAFFAPQTNLEDKQ